MLRPLSFLVCLLALPFQAVGQQTGIPVAECDTDSDQSLSLAELESCQTKLLGALRKPSTLEECDLNGDSGLSKSELEPCFYFLDPTFASATKQTQAHTKAIGDAVSDVLDGRAFATIEEAKFVLASRQVAVSKQEPVVIGSDRLILARKLVDAVDPRKAEDNVALTLSYTDDRVKGNETTDAFVLSGDMTYAFPAHDLGGRDNLSLAFLPTLGLDINTGKDSSESAITVGLPLRWVRTSTLSPENRWFDALSWSVEPKYETDREWRRDAYELAFSLSGRSKRLANAGFFTVFGGDSQTPGAQWRWYWAPTIGVEVGTVTDAGGNADLQKILEAGEYVRFAPGIAVKLMIPYTGSRLSLNAGYTHRFDVTESWNHGFATTSLQYDISKSVALTLTRRKGRKPPDFVDVDDVLLGIGLLQVPEE